MKIGKIPAIVVLLSSFFVLLEPAVALPPPYSGGSGTAGDPYQIGSAADLLLLGTRTVDYGKYFILTADIDLDPNLPGGQVFTTAVIAHDTNNSNWTFDGDAFTGVFDGAGHKIVNLTIDTNVAGNDYLGLFGDINGGQIKNLGLENVNITGGDNSSYLGGLMGYNDSGTVDNSYSTGTVTGGDSSSWLGGLVGKQQDAATISNCHSTVDVASGAEAYELGGLVGRNEDSDVNNCYATGDVNDGDSSDSIGGLVGDNSGGNVNNCYAAGDVYSRDDSSSTGGLVGFNSNATISKSHSTGTVNSGDNSQWLGELVGCNEDGSISNSYSTGSITGGISSQQLGGLMGYNSFGGDIIDCYSAGGVRGGDGASFLGGLVGINYGSINNCFSTANTNSGIDSLYLGGLAGYSTLGNISNCFSTGGVNGEANSAILGGLIGANNCDINNSCSTGAVTGGGGNAQRLGGLAGRNDLSGSISNCYATGAVTEAYYLGGLVGENKGNINNCYSTGDINGTYAPELGGLVGYNNGGSISSCYFPVTEPNNGAGTPLTDAQMKQQSSFINWDFVGGTANGTEDIWWINKGVSYPKLFWQLNVTKCTVTAGSKPNSDKISFSGGNMYAAANDFNDANVIEVTIFSDYIVSPCVQTFPINGKTFKKGKYNYSGTDGKVRKSFTYDLKTHKFAFSASNVDLLGLYCPATIEIRVSDYFGTAQMDEAIVNGPRTPIPIQLMTGVRNVLRVDKCTVKQNNKKANSDQLSANGGFAVENPDVNMPDRVSEDLVITLGTQTFTIPKSKLKAGKSKFTFSKAQVTEGGIATGEFNFKTCAFTLTIKNADIDDVTSGDVNFDVAFADFNVVVQLRFHKSGPASGEVLVSYLSGIVVECISFPPIPGEE